MKKTKICDIIDYNLSLKSCSRMNRNKTIFIIKISFWRLSNPNLQATLGRNTFTTEDKIADRDELLDAVGTCLLNCDFSRRYLFSSNKNLNLFLRLGNIV